LTKKILITGGAGFIGSHTADALIEQGYPVRVLDCLDSQVHGSSRQIPAYLHPDIEFIVADVRDRDSLERALEGVQVVYHMAALTGVTQSMQEIHRYMDVAVMGTAALWDIIVNKRLPIEKIVLPSSRAIYGEGAFLCPACQQEFYPGLRSEAQLQSGVWEIACPYCGTKAEAIPTREDKPLQSLSIYAESKRVQEDMCRIMADTYHINVVALRYFNVYGPRQSLSNPYTGIAPVFCSQIKAGKPLAMYEDGLPVRDFVHVRDIVQANLKALDYQRSDFVALNVGSGEKLTILDMAKAICQQMGAEERLEFTGQYRIGDIRACYADLTQTRALLGFEPELSFKDGVADLVNWVQQQSAVPNHYQESVKELEQSGLMRRSSKR
jgi:dTDP-L-rhamnose 4-epimerase